MKRMLWVCLLVFGVFFFLASQAAAQDKVVVVPLFGTGNQDPPCFDNTNRYVDCGNGTVHDTVTNLIWLKEANCFGQMNWAEANNAAAQLKHGQCGLTDKSSPGSWRLPTTDEWKETIARAKAKGCTSPVLTDRTGLNCYPPIAPPFANVQANGRYWPCDSVDSDPWVTCSIDLSDGFIYTTGKLPTTNKYYVWPIRSAK